MNEKELREQFSERINENFKSNLNDWLTQEPEQLVSDAEEITAAKLLVKIIPQAASPKDMEFLMQFENPLEIVLDGWMSYEQTDISGELKFTLDYAKNNPDMLQYYAKVQEPPTSGMEVTMC